MSPELAAIRQKWYDNVQPGTLVRYNQWSHGYTNKPALIVSINTFSVKAVPSGRPIAQKKFVILVDEITKIVHQDLISPFDGWSNITTKKS